MRQKRPGADLGFGAMSDGDEELVEEQLVEMTFRWMDVEDGLSAWTRKNPTDPENPTRIGHQVHPAVIEAFRVEALFEEGQTVFGEYDARFWYRLLFDVEDADADRPCTLC